MTTREYRRSLVSTSGRLTSIVFVLATSGAAVAEDPFRVLQTLEFGSQSENHATGIAINSAGEMYVTGYVWGSLGPTSFGKYDLYLQKRHADGTVAWTVQYGNQLDQVASAVALDHDGNVYVCGNTRGKLGPTAFGMRDAFVVKFAPSGTRLWTSQIGSTNDEHALDVGVDGAGNIYIVGNTNGSVAGQPAFGRDDVLVVRLDADGEVGWSKTLGTGAHDSGYKLAFDAEDNIVVVGQTSGPLGAKIGGADGFVVKLSPDGQTQWITQVGTVVDDGLESVVILDDGSIVAGGGTNAGMSHPENGYFLVGVSGDGTLLWSRNGQIASGADRVAAVATDTNGMLIAGNSGDNRLFLGRVDASGGVEWATRSIDFRYARDLSVTPDGQAVVCGTHVGSSPNNDSHITVLGPHSCYADCDTSSALDVFDVLCFQNEFAVGNSYADCDKSGVLDIFDFLCFQDEFVSGCP